MLIKETQSQVQEHFCNKPCQLFGFILMIFICVFFCYHFNDLTDTSDLKKNLSISCSPLSSHVFEFPFTSALTPFLNHVHPISSTTTISCLFMFDSAISQLSLQSRIQYNLLCVNTHKANFWKKGRIKASLQKKIVSKC